MQLTLRGKKPSKASRHAWGSDSSYDDEEDQSQDALSERVLCCRMSCMLVLAAVPILGLVIQNSINLQEAKKEKDAGELVSRDIFMSTQQGKIVVNVAVERGTTALYVGSGGDPGVNERFPQLYGNTDAAIAALLQYKWLNDADHPWQFQSLENLSSYIQEHRDSLSVNQTSVEDQLKFYTDINAFFISHLGTTVPKTDTSQVFTDVVAYHLIVMSEEYAGLERALGSVFYARGSLPDEVYVYYNKVKHFGQAYLELALNYVPDIAAIFDRDLVNTTLENNILTMRSEIQMNDFIEQDVTTGIRWFDNMTTYIGILRRLDKHLSRKILDTMETKAQTLSLQLTLNIAILVMVVVVSPLISYGVYKMADDTQSFACRLEKIEWERRKAESLLYQIFPKSIAECMKKNNAVSAQHFKQATVMVSDVVDFTRISAMMPAHQIVDLLNRLYHTMDSAIDLYDVNKVESTGGAYLIVSGLPTTNANKHAGEIASLALHFLKAAEIFNPLYISGKIRLRIGIHSGSCVAGVIGYKRPRYHVFGRTVRTAQKLETSSEAGKIQVSGATKAVLDLLGGYRMAPRTDTPSDLTNMLGDEEPSTFWLLEKDSSGKPGLLAKSALVLSYKAI